MELGHEVKKGKVIIENDKHFQVFGEPEVKHVKRVSVQLYVGHGYRHVSIPFFILDHFALFSLSHF